jgi:hypothetical protein
VSELARKTCEGDVPVVQVKPKPEARNELGYKKSISRLLKHCASTHPFSSFFRYGPSSDDGAMSVSFSRRVEQIGRTCSEAACFHRWYRHKAMSKPEKKEATTRNHYLFFW